MASQSLYRKWRSQTFGDLVGQEPIIRTLKNALNSGSLAHAYLFTGPRGTGKTSTARLLAKTVNCEHPVNGEPCNQCQQCREITAGNSFNVIEIDAASNRGIDSIRDLREKVMMPPSTGKYKVYVLDEAHMLTTEAFNALLKTLEEPPDYAIFVMATTDVHKMLPTVLSRCQRFDFKRITTRQIVEHLKFVAGQEHVKLEQSAAELIARAAAGGMRDALSLLDQAIAYSGDEISLGQVQAMLGVADPRAIQKLIDTVAQLDSPTGLHLIHELSEAGADLRQINSQIGEYWRALMLAKAGADVATILDRTEDETREIALRVQLFGLEELTEFARIFAQNDLMQKNQGTPQLGLELALLQCIELHRRAQAGVPLIAPTASMPSAQPQSRQVSAPVPSRSPIAPAVPSMPSSAQNSQPAPVQPPKTPVNEVSEDDMAELDDVSFHDDGDEAFAPAASTPTNGTDPVITAAATHAQPSLTFDRVHDGWERVKKRVKTRNQTGSRTAAMLNDYAVVAVEQAPDDVIVIIQATHALHYKYLLDNNQYCQDVEWALSLEFGQQCRLRLMPPGQTSNVRNVTASSNNRNQVASAAPVAPQQPAHRERPATKQPPAPRNAAPEAPPRPVQEAPAANLSAVPSSESESEHSQPLVRKNIVRENSNSMKQASSLEVLQEKARLDPVVREVMRTFTADIKEIRPK